MLGDAFKIGAHRAGPKFSNMIRDLLRHFPTNRNIVGNLIRHHNKTCILFHHATHKPAPMDGRTSTAVTLYSGQLVAQSELSVVITLVPLTG